MAEQLIYVGDSHYSSHEANFIAAKLKEVSEGGEKCTSFAACVTLIREGKDADYDGQSGPVTFSDAGDPTEAYIGIYEYQDDNTYSAVKEEFGKL